MFEPLESRWLLAGDWIEWARLLPTADAADTQHTGDGFGVSVAIDGDTAVVGAYADGGARPVAGAAYVFTRVGGSWDLQQKLTASDAQFFDYFGYAVAISGETILVGAMTHDGGGVSESGAAYVFTRSAGVWTEQQKLVASDVGAEDRFGGFVAIDADTAVVGAFGDDTAAGADAGSAYAFVRSSGVWAEQQKLAAPDAAAGDSFGWGLGLDAGTLIVGAYQKDLPSAADAGVAYVYTLSGGVWSHQQTLTSLAPAAGDGFGSSVALYGEMAVVGAYADDTAAGIDAGSGFVFTRSGSTWTAVQQISATDAATGDGFGASVGIGVDTIVVGSYQSDTAAGADAGAVYVFHESSGVWSQQQKLTASSAAAGDSLGLSVAVSGTTVLAGAFQADTPFGADSGAAYFFADDGSAWAELQRVYQSDQDARGDTFGTAVAIDGTTMAVGAPQDDVAGVNAGAAYVFTSTGSDWTLQQKLKAPGLLANDRFGWTIDVWQDTLVVAAPRHTVGAAAEAGAVFVFARSNGAWSHQQTLTAADAAANDWFGTSVALDDGTLIVGAEGDDTAVKANTGSAYVFVVDGNGVWSQQQKLTAADGAAEDYFGNAVALDGDTVIVGAQQHNLFGWNDAGSAYVFVRSGTTWTEQQKLAAPVPYSGAQFGSAVAIRGDQVLVGAEGVDVGFVPRAGVAHLFTRSGTQWSHQQQLSAANPGDLDRFGSAVAIGSELLVIGANLRDSAAGSNVGSAFLFTSDGSTWSQQQEVTGRNQYASDQFGSAVTVSGSMVVVGAPLADLAGGNSGAVYVFISDDIQSPTVAGTTPNLAAGTLPAGTSSLEIEFNEAVVGGDLAANYQLSSLGPDGLLGTADDTVIPLAVSYGGAVATLTFPPLSESVYRLRVRDTLTDSVGNPLDGDYDGTAGGDWVVDVGTVPPDSGVFASQPTYISGGHVTPQAIVHADFDGDGHLDLVTANSGSNDVTLSLGDGAGGFLMVGTFSAGGLSPQAAAVGDFNDDGKADLAVANSGGVGILLGTGVGGFSAPVTYASGGSAPKSVAVGDFNGDGKDDLALANGSSHNVGILLGDGTGGFGEATLFAAGGDYPHPYGVAVGDFNADGKTDLVLANSGYSISSAAVLLGTGTGTFAEPVLYASGGTSPYSVSVADFNGDGKADVATANYNSANVSILLGTGTGGFEAAKTFASGGSYPYFLTSGDFDADGRIDLAVANQGTDKVAILRGYGTGSFAAAVTYNSGGDAPTCVTVGDFNGDNKPDVAVANSGGSNVGVLLGTGLAYAPLASVVTWAAGASLPRAVATGDFNADGHADLAIANEGSNNVGVLLGTGSGEFGNAVTFSSGGTAPYSVAAGDFNSDGTTDLVVVNYSSRNVGVLLGTGTGEFAAAVTYDTGGNFPWSVAVADFNADGALDLAVANSSAGNVGVLLGTGTGGLAPVTTYSSGGSSPRSVAVGDFNRDGKLDLAVSNNGSKNVGLLLGTGTGSFGGVTTYLTGGLWAYAVTVADFNTDGKDDLAVADYAGHAISLLLGNETGGFAAPVQLASGGEGPSALTAGDFNADGKIDLAVTHQSGYNTGSVGMLYGDGTGGFAPAVTYYSGGASAKGLTAGDFNADGLTDLALANPVSQAVSLLFGAGAAGFTMSPTYSVGPTYARSVAVADFNGDGKADVAATNVASDTNISVLLGDGVGGFGAASLYGSGANYPRSLVVADFNKDGILDLGVANNLSSSVDNIGVLLGTGNGGFAPVVRYSSGDNNPHFLTTGDFNGDGFADLAVANGTRHNVGVVLNDGTGRFAPAVTYASGGTYPRGLAVDDFNRDGTADIAVANSNGHNIGILLGDGTGGFAPVVTYASGGAYPDSVVAGDLNGDGIPDLAGTNSESHNVWVLLGMAAGGFAPASVYDSGGLYPSAVTVGDLDGDGFVDLAVANGSSSDVGVLWGTGGGNFTPAASYTAGGPVPNSVAVGDLNSDGKADLVAGVTIGIGVLLNTADRTPSVRELIAPHSMRFAVQTRGFGAGQLVEGSSGAFDGVGRLEVAGQTYAPTRDANLLTDGDRTVVAPTVVIAGLYVSRKITVPDLGNEDFARTVDVFTNPTDQPITTTFRIVGNLGSNAATTIWKTSDGDTTIEPTDQWIGTDDADGTGTPAIIHYIHGPAGLVPTAVSISGDLGDNIEWTYEITVPAGETVRLAHLTIQAETRAAAEAAATALVTSTGFGGQAAAYLSEDELASLANLLFDAAPASLTAVLDGTGNLIVVDSDAGGKDNQLTVGISGGELVIGAASERFIAAPEGGSLSDRDRTLTIPLALVTGSLVVDLAAGRDVLTVDFSSGNPIPAGGIDFHGGEPTASSPGDTLVLDRGTSSGLFHTISHTLINASDGSISLDPDGVGGTSASVITYTGLEPISDNLDAADRVFAFAGGTETITLSDVGGSDGMSLIDSTLGESVTFTNPTASLIIQTTAGTGADAISVEGLDAAFDADFSIAADSDDALRFQTNPTGVGTGDLDLKAGNIRFTETLTTTGSARLEALAGSILGDAASTLPDLVAGKAVLIAETGIDLDLQVGSVEAYSGSGVLSLQNAGALTIGGVTGDLNGIVAGDDITIIAVGDLTVSEPVIDTVGAGYMELGGYTVLINANILTGGSTLDIWSLNDGGAPDDGDTIVNALVDADGGEVYLYCENDATINGTVLTQGSYAEITAFGDIIFTAEGRIEAGVNPYVGWPAFVVDAGGKIMMADGSLIDARDGEVNLFADGDVTISSLVGTWYVSVFSRDGSILDGGDLAPDIVSETVDLTAYRFGAVGTAANPLDLQVDELYGASVAGFHINNAGPLDIADEGIDAGGDVGITAAGALSIAAPIRSGGSVLVSGVGESGTGTERFGIALTDLGRIVATAITLIADSIDLPSGALVDAGAGTVVLRPQTSGTLINLGGADVLAGTPLTLGVSAAELDRIQAGILTIGAAYSGELRITANVIRAAATDVTLVSRAGIVFDSGSIDTAGGTLLFDPGIGVQPLTAGRDATAGSISFADGAALAIRIDGTGVDTGYSQLHVADAVDLTGAVLEISGSHVPAVGDAFTIVNSAGSAPVDGTFTGLPEGAVITNFLGSKLVAKITYVGGDGNDVVLELIHGTRIDMTIVHQPSGTGDNGEVGTLPVSAGWVHEWQSFWVEIWVSTPDTTTVSLTQTMVDLQYHTEHLTAQEIQYGPAFTEHRTGTIEDTAGWVHQVGGRTLESSLAQDDYVLLARVRFVSTGEDQVPVDEAGRDIGPYAMQMALADGQSVLVGGGVVEPQLGGSPSAELWAMVYDIDDNNQIDFGDFSFFAAAFGRTVDAAAEPPYGWWADFDKSGRVDFGDLAFFAPNFNKSRTPVQSGAQTLTFPSNFPDAWRAAAGGGGEAEAGSEGEGESEGESESEGEAAWEPSAGGVGVTAGTGGSQHAAVLPWQLAWVVDEAHAALQAEQPPSLPWGTAAQYGAQPDRLLWEEYSASLYSRTEKLKAASDERPDRLLEDWQPLEDLLTMLPWAEER